MFAVFNLAVCYANGRGMTEDIEKVVKYAKLAAAQDHAGAQLLLGECCKSGARGVNSGDDEAAMYFKLAADQGHAGAFKDKSDAFKYFKMAADQGHRGGAV